MKAVLFILALAFSALASEVPQPQQHNSWECVACEYTMTVIDQVLGENATEEQIRTALDDACNYVPDQLYQECLQLVETYEDKIVELLLHNIQPAKVCGLIDLCGSASNTNAVEASNSWECVACEFVMTYAEDALETNCTEDEVEKLLDDVCVKLPLGMGPICDQFVAEYTPKIVTLLVNKVPASEVCDILGVCGKAPAPSHHQVQVDDEEPFEAKNTLECALCEWVMTELDRLLAGNYTDVAIEDAMDKVCGFLPASLKDACDDFVGQYTPIVVKLLLHDIKPAQVCETISLCGKGAHVQPLAPHHEVAAGNSIECTVCEWAMTYLEQVLEGNMTKSAIEHALDEVCDQLPSYLAPVCDGFVSKYTEKIVKLLMKHIPPQQVCSEMKVCGKAAQVQENSIECTVCEWAMTYLEQVLEGNMTKSAIEHALDEVCGQLPSYLAPVCDGFVSKYTEKIVKLLLKHIPPQQVCSEMKVCGKAAQVQENSIECTVCEWVMTYVEQVLEGNLTKSAIEHALDEVCAQLPSYLAPVCDGFVSKYTEKIVKLLLKHIPPQQVCSEMKVCGKATQVQENSIECTVCEWILTYVEQVLEGNMTKSAIEHALDEVCDQLPSYLAPVCDGFVSKYTEKIVKLLMKHIPPQQVCSEMKVCGKAVEAAVEENSMECTVCDWVLTYLEEVLVGNMTKSAIEHALDQVCEQLPSYLAPVCNSFVKKYTNKIVKALLGKIPAGKVCAEMHVCGKAVQAEVQENGIECTVCEWTMTYLEEVLAGNMTKKAIQSALKEVCGQLPSYLTQTCDAFVKKYSSRIVSDLLKHTPPPMVCAELKVCGAQAVAVQENSIECTVCEWTMTFLEEVLVGNRTKKAIQSALSEVCAQVPVYLTQQCDAFVKKYNTRIVADLMKRAPSPMVCNELKVCNIQAAAPVEENSVECVVCEWVMTYLNDVLRGNVTRGSIKSALNEVCGQLPVYLTSVCDAFVQKEASKIEAAILKKTSYGKICHGLKVCDAQVDAHFEEHENSLQCVVCEWTMAAMESKLGSNVTEENIQHVLDTVCSEMPNYLTAICDSFVAQYTDRIISLLEQQLPPSKVCSAIDLCGKAEVEVAVEDSVECVVCEWVMSYLEDVLKGNMTRHSIEHALDEVCAQLPSYLTSICDGFVKKYTPKIVNLLLKQIPASKVCASMGLCGSSDATDNSDDGTPALRESKEIQVEVSSENSMNCVTCEWIMAELEEMLGQNATQTDIEKALDDVCDRLPEVIQSICFSVVQQYTPKIVELLLHDIAPAQVCELLSVCGTSQAERDAMEDAQEEGENSMECVVCEFVMTILDDMLGSNFTEVEVQAALDKVCSYLPAALSGTCDGFVAQYAPVITELLVHDIETSKVCNLIGLCGATLAEQEQDLINLA